MKSLKIILAAAVVSLAATEAEKKGAGVVFEYNVLAKQGATHDNKTLCYYRNGMYFTYKGQDYVIDVEPLRCKYKSRYEGEGGLDAVLIGDVIGRGGSGRNSGNA